MTKRDELAWRYGMMKYSMFREQDNGRKDFLAGYDAHKKECLEWVDSRIKFSGSANEIAMLELFKEFLERE